MKQQKIKRENPYKLVFRPEEYFGGMAAQVAHLADHEKPLLTRYMHSLRRCYQYVGKNKILWAAIYDRRKPHNSPPEAVYTADNEWNNSVMS